MLTAKRVIIATLCGVLFGFVCMMMASANPEGAGQLDTVQKISIVLGRTMLGFMIGISAFKLQWWLHGIVLGIIASIPMAIPVMHDSMIMTGTIVMGLVYGFLTELITSVLFKARGAAWK